MRRVTRNIFIPILFFLLQSVVGGEAIAQICNLIGNNGSDQKTDKTCAPVTLTMPVNYAFLTPVDPSRVQIRYVWNDGTPNTTINATFNAGLNRYEAEAVHTYPPGGECSYTAEAYVVYDGVECISTRQRQTFASWAEDDQNSGVLISDPVLYRVCKGLGFTVDFRDNSLFNCRVEIEQDKPNQLSRWVQFIYGPNNNVQKIPNVSVIVPGVGTFPLTDASGNVVNYPTPSGFYEGPVIEIPALALGPNQTSYQITAPPGAEIDDFFEITLRNWNICNPYRDFNGVLTGNAPRTTTSRVVIVASPDANIRITKNSNNINEPEVTKFCPGDQMFLRATTIWPANAAVNHIVSFYDGPDTTYPRLFRRTSTNRNYTTNFVIPNNATPGKKLVIIESIDGNANNISGVSECSDIEIKEIEVVDAPIAQIANSIGPRHLDFCKENDNDVFPISFIDNPGLINPTQTVFTWRFIDKNKNIDTLVGPSYGQQIPAFVDVPYSDPGAYQVIYYTDDLVTRCGTTDTVFINIHIKPIADFELVAQQVYCARREIEFNDLSQDFFSISKLESDKIISRKWYFDYDNYPSIFEEFDENEKISHVYTVEGSYKVRLEIETGFAGCSDIQEKEILIEILPSPEVNFTPPPPACPSTFTFTNLSFNNQPPNVTGPVTYYWVISDEDDNFIEERVGNNTTFDYIFTNDQLVDKIYKVRLKAISENNCEIISDPADVTVNPAMPARFSSDYDPFNLNCSPTTINFTVDAQTQTLDVNKYIWTINDGENDPLITEKTPAEIDFDYNFNNISNNVKTYIVSLEVILNTPFCVNPFQQPVKINPVPASDFTIEPVMENCDMVRLNFNAASKGLNYIWTFNTPSLNNPVKNDNFNLDFARPEANEADFVIEARLETVNSTHCRSTITTEYFTIPRKSFVQVQLETTPPASGCDVFTGIFRNITLVGYPAGTTFDLLVRNGGGAQEVKAITSGDILNDFTYQFESDGQFEVVLKATTPDGCTFFSPPQMINVHPAVKALFIANVEEGCSPLEVSFTDASTKVSDIDHINWTIRNIQSNDIISTFTMAAGESWTHTFLNTTTAIEEYEILQEVFSTEGCLDSYSLEIKIFPEAHSDFEVVDLPICFPYEVIFRNNALSENPAGTVFTWYWGDGTYSQSSDEYVSHIFFNSSFSANKNHRVTLRATTPEECEALSFKDIVINHKVSARIEADKLEGCSPLTINFNNYSRGHTGPESAWYYREEGTSNYVQFSTDKVTTVYTFENNSDLDKNFEILYIAQSIAGCSDTTSTTITVFAALNPTFTATPERQTLPNKTVEIFNHTIPGDWSFYWEFGDGTISTLRDPGTHEYPTYGEYEIKLAVSGNNCTERYSTKIMIDAIIPVVDFSYDKDSGCRPLTVQFTDNSLFTDPSTYLWNFGDGRGTSTAQNPSYVYSNPGIYTVTLTASNITGLDVTVVKEYIIEIFDNPRAIFQVRPTTVYLPDRPLYTSNTSIGAVSYLWDFGDGTTSTEFEPKHVYTATGVYDISLTVTSIEGCTDTYILKRAVKVEEGGELRIPNAFTPNLDGPQSGGGAGINDIFMPITEGVVEFNMLIFNRWGELLYESKRIEDGWDGYYRGKLCKQDVYVYKIYVKYLDGETATRIGDVTLMR